MRDRRKGGAKAPQITQPQGLAALVTSFLERLSSRDYSQPSIDAHRWALRQFTGWAGARGEHDPSTFTRADLEAYQLFLHHYRSPRGGKPLVTNTQVARLGCVRRFFAWLCRAGLIPANPAADLDLPRKQARQMPKNLSEHEIQLLLAIPNTADPFGLRDRTILELFYATGVRRTEMTQLDHGDYDSSAQTLLIRKGKNGKSRLLPVGERAASWLDRYLTEIRPLFDFLPNETALFLTGYGTRYTPAYLGNWVAKLLKNAGIDKPGACHLFRHSCATDMHIGGADIRFVQEMLGHARLETTQIYTHVNISALQEVHARTHPHGTLRDDAEFSGPETSSVGKDFQTEEISASNLSPDLINATQEMPAVPTPLTVNAIPVSYRISEEDSGPDDEDYPPESGPSTPTKRPGPTNPKNPYNSFVSDAFQPCENRLERGRVTYYQYRWYDPMTGRWPSRDPIGELGGVNLFGFIRNRPIGKIDLLGLEMPSFFEPSPQPEQSKKERFDDLRKSFLENFSGGKPAPACSFKCKCVFTFDFVKRDKEAWDKFLQDLMLDFDKSYRNPGRGRDFKPGNTEPGMSKWDDPTSPDVNNEAYNEARRKYKKEVEEYINNLSENWDARYSALQGVSRQGEGESAHENIARWKAMEKLKDQLRAVYEERGGKTLEDSDLEVLRTAEKPPTALNFAKCKCLKFIDGDGKEPHYPEVNF